MRRNVRIGGTLAHKCGDPALLRSQEIERFRRSAVDPLAGGGKFVLSTEVEPADKVQVEADGDELKFDVERGAASQEVTGWSEESEATQTQEHAAAR